MAEEYTFFIIPPMNTPRASKLPLINRIVGRVASSFGRSPSDIQLTEHEDRRLHLEILESRILYSGSPAPAPEAPAEVVEATESQVSASSPTNTESNDTGETGDVELAQETESVDAEANPTVLTQEALLAMVDAATQRWIDSGISDAQIDALESATYQIADLGDNRLGLTSGSTVSIDDDAGGTGAWFIDETPLLDEEFRATETNLMQGKTTISSLTLNDYPTIIFCSANIEVIYLIQGKYVVFYRNIMR